MRYLSFLIAMFLASTLVVMATPTASAQAPAVQKAFEEVKTKLDDLVSAKDENLADDLVLRIQAFKKVLEFSAEEAKTLKVKLLSTELEGIEKEVLAAWRTRVEDGIAAAENHYKEVFGALTTTTTPLDLQGVKNLAASFKEWREVSLAPIVNEAEEFLLVAGQARALKVADSRLTKIASDVAKLERAKIRGTETLSTHLKNARISLGDAKEAYERAHRLLLSRLAPPVEIAEEGGSPELTATSTEPVATSTEAVVVPTIRDEVRNSLEKVKAAYLSFIEMSVEVKKILK